MQEFALQGSRLGTQVAPLRCPRDGGMYSPSYIGLENVSLPLRRISPELVLLALFGDVTVSFLVPSFFRTREFDETSIFIVFKGLTV